MSTDLKYLLYTAALTASLWLPYVICQVLTNGFLSPGNYKDPTPRPVPAWGRRADRTLMNAVETFAPFAAIVSVAHLAGKTNETTAFWAVWFFWMRLGHAIVYLTGIPYLRTLLFTLGYVAVLAIFWQVIK